MNSHRTGTFSLILIISCLVASAGAAPVLEPGKLITVAELEQIVGKISDGPKSGESPPPEVSCEYTVAKDSSWINVALASVDQETFDRYRGVYMGKSGSLVPEFGKNAFVNPEYASFSAELFVKKGDVVLRVSMPKGPGAVENIKAIARKALSRM